MIISALAAFATILLIDWFFEEMEWKHKETLELIEEIDL